VSSRGKCATGRSCFFRGPNDLGMTTSSTGDLMIVLRVTAEHLLDHVVHFLGERFAPLHCFPLSRRSRKRRFGSVSF
jgi:hypothetical protein